MNTATAAANAQPAQAFHHAARSGSAAASAQRVAQSLELLKQQVPMTRRIVRGGEPVCRAGEALDSLHVIHVGCVKTINLAADGREQVVGLHFKGDWLGFDGIAKGQMTCDAVAMDVTEVWSIRYPALLKACAENPQVMALVHAAMSREIGRDRDSMMSLCTVRADARVAGFLHAWAEALSASGVRTDEMRIPMSRAEIGNYLGMTLETVSRAMARLEREQLIRFGGSGRRNLQIPDLDALARFVQGGISGENKATLLH